MIHSSVGKLAAAMIMGGAFCSVVHAADPLPPQSRLVATSNAPVPTPALDFTISNAEDLQVTLTDLQIPAAMANANVVITQGDMVAGSAALAAPASSATFSLSKAVGSYTLFVFGTPGASVSVGTFTVCVAPKANPSACIASASLAGNITADSSTANPAVSTLSTNFTITVAGSYTFTATDFQFPVALASAPNLALFQGSTSVQLGITSGSMINLAPGVYTLLAIAEADATALSGLYGVTVSGPGGTAAVFDSAIPVGQVSRPSPFDNPSAGPVTLKVSDFAFPGPLNGASALLTQGGSRVGQASAAGGSTTFSAPAGALYAWTFAAPGSLPGTYEVDVLAGASHLYTTAQGVSPPGSSTYAYAYVTPTSVAAGSYQATVVDLEFPSQLTALSFAAAQNGVILKKSSAAGTLSVTAAAAPVVFLVSAQTPGTGSASGNGLFDVNLQTGGSSPQLVYDKVQTVSNSAALFDSQTLTLGTDANFDATLVDLDTPAAFANLALVVSRGSTIAGKIYGGGTFSFPGSVGDYQLTFVASPAAQQQFGLYGTQITFAAPAITSFTSSVSSAATNTPITLTWATTSATSCTGTGGGWTGSTTSGSESLVLSATTTYTLSCVGPGGKTSKSVTVNATAASSSGGGGGALDLKSILALAFVLCAGLSVRGYGRRQVAS